MTTYSAKIIIDSIGDNAPRLTSIQLRYPLVVHAELMTHRVFSRNARSSRAVPTAKMIEEVQRDPFIPTHWGANQPGMQALEEIAADVEIVVDYDHVITRSRENAWLFARDRAVEVAQGFMRAGYAKQVCNRLLMPFLHIDTLVTATEFENWYELRDHGDADPHIRPLARAMREAMTESVPKKLTLGEWHLPYIAFDDWEGAYMGATADEAMAKMQMVSAARCARISYAPFVESEVAKDVELARKLAASKHWSPFEHQATPDEKRDVGGVEIWFNPKDHRNFVGWRQHRGLLDAQKVAT